MLDVIRDLYVYTRWANARMLEAVADLRPDALGHDVGGSFPTVRDTLSHMLGADWIWLERWLGRSPGGFPDHWELTTLDAIRSRWSELEAERGTFLDSLTAARLEADLSYRNTRGETFSAPLRDLLLHVVNHGTYHRGQVVNQLRQLGRPGVSTDLVVYQRERRS